jgi:hypothetical protein
MMEKLSMRLPPLPNNIYMQQHLSLSETPPNPFRFAMMNIPYIRKATAMSTSLTSSYLANR